MKLTIFLFFFSWINICLAQENKPGSGFGIEVNSSAGKIFKHSIKLRAPIPEFSTAVEVNFVQKTFGKKDWQQRRLFPQVGCGLSFTNYGIDSIYGKCLSIYPNLQIPIITGKKLEWTFRVGFGLGYVTKRFERAPSYDTFNTAIGSHFNNYTKFTTDLRYHINEHWDVQIGGNFSHISNASLRSPNLGINYYGAQIGVRYFPVISSPQKMIRNLPNLKNRILVQLRAGLGANESGDADGPLYPVYIFSAYASRRYASKNKLFVGLDYSYHRGVYAFLRNNELFTGEEKQHSWKSSVFIGNEFLMGRFGIMLQVGVYIKEAALKQDPYYEKLGTNIYIIQNEKGVIKELFTSVLLKTHKTIAEFVEIGLGVGF